ncbi:MAG: DinB family protein [Acidobacteriia bacterium]|nr:DinB family protein [Terriglobia bacterium]
MLVRPQANEYDPYYERYISLVPGADIVTALQTQLDQTIALLSAVSEEKAGYRYAPGKWSVKEVLGHVTDTERIFAYRALRIARNDRTPIEGFEQDGYVQYGPFSRYRLQDLVQEFGYVRDASLSLFQKLNQEDWGRRGIANNAEISVRALAFVMAGHELHHRKVLKEKYGIG